MAVPSNRIPHTQISTLFSKIPVKVVAPPATNVTSRYLPGSFSKNEPGGTSVSLNETKRYKKRKIPAAIREAVWIKHCGRAFEHKCLTSWCQNTITAFDFQCGHNIPESKGGTLAMSNLYPLCARCNVSMGDRYTIDEWNAIQSTAGAVANAAPVAPKRTWGQFFSCLKAGKQPEPRQPASPSRPASR